MFLYFLSALSSYCSLRKEPFVDPGKLQSFYSKERLYFVKLAEKIVPAFVKHSGEMKRRLNEQWVFPFVANDSFKYRNHKLSSEFFES